MKSHNKEPDMDETEHLLSSKGNAEHLKKSIEQGNQGSSKLSPEQAAKLRELVRATVENASAFVTMPYSKAGEHTYMEAERQLDAYITSLTGESNLLSALQSLCIVFADVCERNGYSPGEYYSYRVAQDAIDKALGETK